jgi:hypothetical protein
MAFLTSRSHKEIFLNYLKVVRLTFGRPWSIFFSENELLIFFEVFERKELRHILVCVPDGIPSVILAAERWYAAVLTMYHIMAKKGANVGILVVKSPTITTDAKVASCTFILSALKLPCYRLRVQQLP